MTTTTRKKLIEVALPLEAINTASAREKSIRHGHPSTLHLWWARRPLAAARAVIFSQMVDDPSEYVTELTRPNTDSRRAAEHELRKRCAAWESRPDPNDDTPEPTLEDVAADIERQRLFRLMEDLVKWENTTNEAVLQAAREEIWRSWQRTCADNAGHPQARELFNRDKLPAFHDPFAGGGALPLEAQRLGLEAYASDLNPVAVLINKAMIEIPPKFAGQPPVNPESRKQWIGNSNALSGAGGVAEGDAGGTGGLSTGTPTSQGGDLRNEVPDNQSGDVDTGEHRGGMGTGIGAGESPVLGNRPGFSGGNRDPVDALRTDWVDTGDGNSSFEGHAYASGQNADDDAQTASRKSLTPTSYSLFPTSYKGAQGLAEDVRYYGQWMRDEAEKRIGHLYPKIEVTAEMVAERPDLKPYLGKSLTVIAWIWARTVRSPNPAFAEVDVPLASTFMLSTKVGREAYVEPVIENGGYRFTVKMGKPTDPDRVKRGTKLARGANFECVMSGAVISDKYIKAESMSGRVGERLMAIVAESSYGRIYLSPDSHHERIARSASPVWKPETEMNRETSNLVSGRGYGFFIWADLFTPRQLVALTTFSDLVGEAREKIKADAATVGHANPQAYADAVGTYLAFGVDKCSDYWNSISTWMPRGTVGHLFARHAIPMTWDFPEPNPLSNFHCAWQEAFEWVSKSIETLPTSAVGSAAQADAHTQTVSADKLVSTDPPYYDNIGYADLSDFFYVWLRRSLRGVYPDLFATVAVPKAEELVATPYRHGSKEKAETFFLDGMTQAMHRLAEQAHPAFPVTIYYAFKQSETERAEGTSSTGWETFLDAVFRAGFGICGTWPMRTERAARSIGIDTNALASSILLVCRQRPADAPTATRREFVAALKAELPTALRHLQQGNIAPVDLAQAAIGPGMAVYTRYAKVLDAEGRPLSVREALALINQVLDETLAEQEGDFDADSRFAIAWFEQHGFAKGDFGTADVLARAKNTSVDGLRDAGILESKLGNVRLLKAAELPEDWDPALDARFAHWEAVHHLIRALEAGGESAAAALVARLGTRAETARELAYRLYTVSERHKRAAEALQYNALVQSWPEISRLAREGAGAAPPQTEMEL
jgi:putative DNA methylase